MKYPLHALLYFILIFSCTTKSPISNRYVSKKKNIEHLVKLGNMNWEKRVDIKSAKLSKHFLSKAIELDSNNPETVALFSRSCYFNGRYLNYDNPDSADSLFIEGYKTAWNFIIRDENYQFGFQSVDGDSITKKIAGLEKLSGKTLHIAYWWAENFTSYLLTKPVLKRLENREVVETVLHRILSEDPGYNFHGANRIFGSFYAKLPGVILEQSKNNFDKTISSEPNFMTSYLMRAQFYYTKSGDRDSFVKDLRFVLNAEPTIIPEASPENLFEQELARILLSKEESLFE